MENAIKISPYLTHIRLFRNTKAPFFFLGNIQAEHHKTLFPSAWKTDDTKHSCEAISLSGFCGFETYRNKRLGHVSKIILYTNTYPVKMLELNAEKTTNSDSSKEQSNMSQQIWSSMVNWIQSRSSNATEFGDDLTEITPDQELVQRLLMPSHALMDQIFVSKTPFSVHSFALQQILFHFQVSKDTARVHLQRNPSRHHIYTRSGAGIRSSNLFYSPENPSIFHRANEIEQEENYQRDMVWCATLIAVVLLSMYLLKRCANR